VEPSRKEPRGPGHVQERADTHGWGLRGFQGGSPALVLTRKVDEWIDIPAAGISILVCQIDSTRRVRLGICAPDENRIFRRELMEKVRNDTSAKEPTNRREHLTLQPEAHSGMAEMRVQGKRVDRADGDRSDAASVHEGTLNARSVELPARIGADGKACDRQVLEKPAPDHDPGTSVPE